MNGDFMELFTKKMRRKYAGYLFESGKMTSFGRVASLLGKDISQL